MSDWWTTIWDAARKHRSHDKVVRRKYENTSSGVTLKAADKNAPAITAVDIYYETIMAHEALPRTIEQYLQV